MPYRWETNRVKLPRSADRRVKLSEIERDDILRRHKAGEGIREIARAYEGICSRRTVQFVLFPERAQIVAKHAKDRQQHKKTYQRVKGPEWAKTMREYRAYKNKVIKGRVS